MLVPIFGNFEEKNMNRNTSISIGAYFDEFIQMDIQTIECNKAIIFEDESLVNIKNEWENVFQCIST